MKINDKDQLQLKFLLGRSLFLGGGISLMLNAGDKDAWLAIILGFLIGIPFIYLYSYLSLNQSIHDYLAKNNILNILIKALLLLYYLFIIFFLVIIFSIFIYSFYLPFTKTLISCTPFLFLAVFLSTKNNPSIIRVAKVLFYINLALLIFKYSMLVPHLKLENFLPIFTIGSKKLFKTAIIFALFATSPYLLLIDAPTSFKTNLKCYTANALIIFVMLFYLIGCFGGALSRTFSYPEFSILRQINVFNFIQNIESFLAVNWLFDIFIALTLASKKIKNILNYQKNTWTYLIFLGILLITSKFIIGNYKNAIFVYHISSYVLASFLLIIFLFLLIKKNLSKA